MRTEFKQVEKMVWIGVGIILMGQTFFSLLK